MQNRDFSLVSEAPGIGVTKENASMLMTRYAFARGFCEGKDVLEMSCAAGMGLGYLAAKAKSIVGADYDPQFIKKARQHYGDRIPVHDADAQSMPFPDASFDTVIMMEAIYFLPDAAAFLREANRVLKPGGTLVLVSANCEYHTFNPCDRATRYFSAQELAKMLVLEGFDVRIWKGFPDKPRSIKSKLLGLARKLVVSMHLIPNTMKGKELMKRLAYGKLIVLPDEIGEHFAEVGKLERVQEGESLADCKVFYIAGEKLR